MCFNNAAEHFLGFGPPFQEEDIVQGGLCRYIINEYLNLQFLGDSLLKFGLYFQDLEKIRDDLIIVENVKDINYG